jgi:hypothetical protein
MAEAYLNQNPADSSRSEAPHYVSRHAWNDERPHTLVVACSDGRLQQNLDDFLNNHLGIHRYDRLYAPGGPGALTSHGVEFLRSDQFRREYLFLVKAHAIEEILLIFHGPSPDGPEQALCADYRRIYPRYSAHQIREQQERDVAEIVNYGFGFDNPGVRLSVYRCEVTAGNTIQFVSLRADSISSRG